MKFPGMITQEQESKKPDVGVLPNSEKMSGNEMVGIKDQGYLTKKGTPSGLSAVFNYLPPGMDITDQENADIRAQSRSDYKGGISYPRGWLDVNSIAFVLQVIALICLLFAALNILPRPVPSWGWLGMFLWLLSLMLGGFVLHTAGSPGMHY